MDRKTLIAVGLSVAVIIISLIIQTKFFPVPSRQAISNNYVDNTFITETQKTEVNKVQEKFENNVKTSLNVIENPFKLIYEGELDKQ